MLLSLKLCRTDAHFMLSHPHEINSRYRFTQTETDGSLHVSSSYPVRNGCYPAWSKFESSAYWKSLVCQTYRYESTESDHLRTSVISRCLFSLTYPTVSGRKDPQHIEVIHPFGFLQLCSHDLYMHKTALSLWCVKLLCHRPVAKLVRCIPARHIIYFPLPFLSLSVNWNEMNNVYFCLLFRKAVWWLGMLPEWISAARSKY